MNLSCNGMGDDGVLALTTPLQHLLMLTALDLRLNSITAAGLAVLSPCISLLPVLQARLLPPTLQDCCLCSLYLVYLIGLLRLAAVRELVVTTAAAAAAAAACLAHVALLVCAAGPSFTGIQMHLGIRQDVHLHLVAQRNSL